MEIKWWWSFWCFRVLRHYFYARRPLEVVLYQLGISLVMTLRKVHLYVKKKIWCELPSPSPVSSISTRFRWLRLTPSALRYGSFFKSVRCQTIIILRLKPLRLHVCFDVCLVFKKNGYSNVTFSTLQRHGNYLVFVINLLVKPLLENGIKRHIDLKMTYLTKCLPVHRGILHPCLVSSCLWFVVVASLTHSRQPPAI